MRMEKSSKSEMRSQAEFGDNSHMQLLEKVVRGMNKQVNEYDYMFTYICRRENSKSKQNV